MLFRRFIDVLTRVFIRRLCAVESLASLFTVAILRMCGLREGRVMCFITQPFRSFIVGLDVVQLTCRNFRRIRCGMYSILTSLRASFPLSEILTLVLQVKVWLSHECISWWHYLRFCVLDISLGVSNAGIVKYIVKMHPGCKLAKFLNWLSFASSHAKLSTEWLSILSRIWTLYPFPKIETRPRRFVL